MIEDVQSTCQVPRARAGVARNIQTRARGAGARARDMSRDNTKKRGNYNSGEDYVLEYGELRFTFNEEDFRQRVEQAAVKLSFVKPGLATEELDDLVNLAVNGEIREPSSPLGEHVNERWYELVGPADRSLVHWLRRLVFRGAWLDQRVKEGELDIYFHEDTHSFGYVQPDRDSELIELSPEPAGSRSRIRAEPPPELPELPAKAIPVFPQELRISLAGNPGAGSPSRIRVSPGEIRVGRLRSAYRNEDSPPAVGARSRTWPVGSAVRRRVGRQVDVYRSFHDPPGCG